MESLWHDRNFKTIISANMLSHIGSGITMIGVPWYLVTMDNGERTLGLITLLSTILLFFLAPYVGVIIDRYSRVRIHRICDFIGFMTIGSFAIWGLSGGTFETSHLMMLYLTGVLYYTVHYPTMFALNQEIFSSKVYGKLNSIMEIQGQAASMLAGAVASIMIVHWGLSVILLIDAITYITAFFLFALIRYEPKVEPKDTTVKITAFSDMAEGWRFLKEKPLLIVFFLATMIPFLTIMITNYLFPIYVAKTLEAGPSVFAMNEVIYAIGAVLAGITIQRLTSRFGYLPMLLGMMTLFWFAIVSISLIQTVYIFLGMVIVLGWGNAGIRINRNTLLMEIVPNRLIGRINSFFAAIEKVFRVSLIAVFTATVHETGASLSLLFQSFLILFAIFAIWGVRSVINLSNESTSISNPAPKKLVVK
ncbi:MFS transporter [Alkalihalobacillus sp. AL-G]|uniref:MFS transporter n=1 Tax=Alkalihalobacillus sp. AL-G TaxID=2926399 RepID=UPI00272B412D|nr:MFS transporter [Alkalihalobacillus sp. AL-G]WLD94336.1 MFS transporter [Alkalihalobacillus sp. AL-G]